MNNNVNVNGLGFHATSIIYGLLRGGLLAGAWLVPRFLPDASSNVERSFTIVLAFLGAFLLVSFLYGQLYLRKWVKEIYGDYVSISPLTYFDLAFFHFISLKNNKGYSIRFGRKGSKFNIILTPDDSEWILIDPRTQRTFEEKAAADKRFFHYYFEGMDKSPRADDSFYVLGDENGDPHIFVVDGLALVSVVPSGEAAMDAREKGYILLECPRVRLDEMYLELHKRELLILLTQDGGRGLVYSGKELVYNRENRFFID